MIALPISFDPAPIRRIPGVAIALLAALLLGAANTASAMQIFIKIPGGSVEAFEVEASDSVLNIKQKIEDRVFVPIAEQVLLFAGKVLEDNRTLSDYNIQKESSLALRIPKLEEEIKQLQALVAKAKKLEREILATLRALERAKTPAAFNRAKLRARSRVRELTGILLKIGESPGEVAKIRRQLDRLFAQLKFPKTKTRPKQRPRPRPIAPLQVNRLISY